MTQRTALIYNPEINSYHFGKTHPFNGERFKVFVNFLKKNLENFNDYFEEFLPKPATEKDLALFHSQEYTEVIKKASSGIILPDIFKYISADNVDFSTGYLPKDIEKPARIIAGTSLLAGELVLKGKFKKAIGVGGGLHHARKSFGEGFCIYNDVVICAKNLLNKGLKKILILDTDAHAGNGVMEAFYEENQVLFIDIHQDPKTLYPGTGFIEEVGQGKGQGFTINIPLLPWTSDNEGFKMIGEKVRALADFVCQGKEVDLIASGYNKEILPLAWTALISGLLDLKIKLKDPKQKLAPSKNSKFKETKEIAKELKRHLKEYWRCLE